jgi:apolipoprotein N-acyltransferase
LLNRKQQSGRPQWIEQKWRKIRSLRHPPIAIHLIARHGGHVDKLTQFIGRHRALFSLFAGALSAAGFAPYLDWPVALAGLSLFIYLVAKSPRRRDAMLTGWLFGISHFTIGNQWIAVAFTFQAAMPIWLGYIAVVALALLLAVYPALAATGAWHVGDIVRRRGKNATIPFALAFAAMWIITEWLRSWVFTGFVWNPLSVIAIDSFASTPMRTVGTYGMSGIVILAAAILLGLFGAVVTVQGKAVFARLLDAAMLSLACLLLGWAGAGSSVTRTTPPQAITITQPNISQTDKYKPGYTEVNFARLAANSRPLPGQGPRLLIWPEAAIPYQLESGYPFRYYQFQPGESAVGARMALAGLMGKNDVLLTGGDKLEFDRDGQLIGARNSMFALGADTEIIGSYDKAHLVPYGEYLPLAWLLKPLGLARLVPGDINFWSGPGARTLNLGTGRKVGFQICYEIIFSGQVVDRANRPDFIVNSSNDAWFGTVGPPQFLEQARLRALEEGLPVIRATPTGISAIIDADGRILRSLPLGKAGRIDDVLPPPNTPTFFAKTGNAASLAFAVSLLALALVSLVTFPVVTRRTSR